MTQRRIRRYRLNARRAIILGIVVLVALPTMAGLGALRGWLGRSALLGQAQAQEALKPPRHDLALKYLNEYLANQPDDAEALDLKARILADFAQSGDQVLEAIKLDEQALRLTPAAPFAQDARRRLLELHLRLGRYVPLNDLRLQTAEQVGRELLAKGDNSARSIRLLGQVLEARALGGDSKALPEAVTLYRQALKADPTDVDGAELLAAIYQDPLRLNRPSDALLVLDSLLSAATAAEAKAATPEAKSQAARKVAETRLGRYRYFARSASLTASNEPRRQLAASAQQELNEALVKAPDNLSVLLTATEYALQRGDIDGARRYFDRIPPDPEHRRPERERMGIRLIQGLIDLAENQADDAVESWRQGLVMVGGTNTDLTWRLAYILIQMGRIDEAEPLVAQHRRLTGGSEPTPEHYFLLGTKLLRQNRPVEAITALSKAQNKVSPAYEPKLRYTLGQCYEAIRDEASALDQYARATKLDPKWSPPRLAHARLLQARHPADAEAELSRALEDTPDDPFLLLSAARVEFAKQTRKPVAERSWDALNRQVERLKAIAPSIAGLTLLQADMRLAAGRLEEAAALLEQAVRHDKKDADLWVAWAAALNRLNRPQDALRTLEQAAAPDAAGDQAAIRVARARLLTALGNGQAARDALVRDVERLRPDQRPLVWAELGNMLQQRRELGESRKAYAEWARLLPDDPQPQLVLTELALIDGDRDAARDCLTTLEKIVGTNGLYYRVARVQDLLRETPEGSTEGAESRAARYDEAEALINKIEIDAPQERYGYLLRGLLFERRNQIDRAITAYERALNHDGGQQAVARLVVLYTRAGRFADLEALKRQQGDSAKAVAQLSALEAFKVGNKDIAEKMAQQVAEGEPDSLDTRVWQARMLNSLGKPEEAERTLQDLINRHADQPGPWLALMFFQVGRNRPKDALATIEKMKTKVTKIELPDFVWAQCYRAAGDLDKAEAAYKAALAKWPNDPRIVRGVVGFYEATNRLAEAEAGLRDLLKRDPSQRWATRTLALLVSSRPDPKGIRTWDEAWAMVKELPKSGDTPEERLTRALVLARHPDKSHLDESIKLLEDLVADLPADLPTASNARGILAGIYTQQGKTDKLGELAAMSASTPASIAVHAELLIRNGKLEEAQKQVNRLALAAPDDLMTVKIRALLLKAQKRPDQAIALIEKVFKNHEAADDAELFCRELLGMLGAAKGTPVLDAPEVAERLGRRVAERWPAASWMLARILSRRGDTRADEVFRLCQASVNATTTIDRDASEAGQIALALGSGSNASEGERNRADAILTALNKRDPKNADVILMLAFLRHSQGRIKEEVDLYHAAEAVRPANPLYLNNLAWALSEELGRAPEALETINSLISRISDDDPQILDTRACILLRMGRPSDAVKDLERVLKAKPDNAVYAYHLARAYLKAGNEANFRKYLDIAKKAGLAPDKLERSEREELKQLLAL